MTYCLSDIHSLQFIEHEENEQETFLKISTSDNQLILVWPQICIREFPGINSKRVMVPLWE